MIYVRAFSTGLFISATNSTAVEHLEDPEIYLKTRNEPKVCRLMYAPLYYNVHLNLTLLQNRTLQRDQKVPPQTTQSERAAQRRQLRVQDDEQRESGAVAHHRRPADRDRVVEVEKRWAREAEHRLDRTVRADETTTCQVWAEVI